MENNRLDPEYVQIDKEEFASLLSCSISELDKMRREDPSFPRVFVRCDAPNAKLYFRLADAYRYSERLMGEPA